ncbi:hypothetical protein DSO57_1003570 [Entomophthora muscae]|uniref:Uncharacterized protein n=1 Tax=Entomophthora muscae TaxID=34485 RepID=A0ACC2RZG7_9FUNG|nr:hypothetical protein DSO57_1003570 [Entomophthora muscae]
MPLAWPNSSICPPVLQELKYRVHGTFPMTGNILAGLTHAKGESEWEVTAYKDAQLVCLDLVILSGVYCVNSIELVWDVLETLPFNNVPEIFSKPGIGRGISWLGSEYGRARG